MEAFAKCLLQAVHSIVWFISLICRLWDTSGWMLLDLFLVMNFQLDFSVITQNPKSEQILSGRSASPLSGMHHTCGIMWISHEANEKNKQEPQKPQKPKAKTAATEAKINPCSICPNFG